MSKYSRKPITTNELICLKLVLIISAYLIVAMGIKTLYLSALEINIKYELLAHASEGILLLLILLMPSLKSKKRQTHIIFKPNNVQLLLCLISMYSIIIIVKKTNTL